MSMTLGLRHATGATNGAPVVITGESSGAATAIDTAVASMTSFDVLTITLQNLTSGEVTCTLKYGAVLVPVSLAPYGDRTVKRRINNSMAVAAFVPSGLGGTVIASADVTTITVS